MDLGHVATGVVADSPFEAILAWSVLFQAPSPDPNGPVRGIDHERVR